MSTARKIVVIKVGTSSILRTGTDHLALSTLASLVETICLLDEGVDAEAIDQVALDFGMPMGPVELADQVGLDICLDVADMLRERMIEDMRIRGMSPKTQQAHIRAVRYFAEFIERSPDTATPDDLRAYQLQMSFDRRV